MLPSLGVGEQRNKMETLEAFRLAGKIRYAGFSNWSQSRAEEAHLTAQRLGVKGFVASQNMWSLAKVDLAQADPTWNYIDAGSFVDSSVSEPVNEKRIYGSTDVQLDNQGARAPPSAAPPRPR
jgi:hypothetical protein